jgi:all-trans-retinol 13,14-reductase
MSKEVVLIGGGLGGLVSASLLSKEGYKVTVLERHSRIGGGLHCFKRYGKTFETGIHYVSGFQEDGVLRKIFTYLGIFDKLDIMPMNPNGFDVLHIAADNTTYSFGVGKENFIRILSEKFPAESDNISRLMDALYAICEKIPLYNLKSSASESSYFDENFLIPVGKFIETFTSNEKLKAVLAWNNSLYAGSSDSTPIYMHALVTKFYIEGASRFVGGSQQLANAMVDLICANGGQVLCSTRVEKVVVENKKVAKVITADGREFTGEFYISSIHPSNLMDMIDPDQIQRAYRQRLKNLENTYSAFTLFVSLKPDTFPFLNHSYYYHSDYSTIWNNVSNTEEKFPPGFMLLTPPSENQSEYADRALINCVMSYEKVRKWENTGIGKRGKEYEAFKISCEEEILDMVEKAFPGFRDNIDRKFSSSPLTIRDYYGSKEGSLYGYKKDCHNFIKSQLLPRTKIQNLFLTGQNINLHGIIGVSLSAIVSVGEIVGTDTLLTKIRNIKL